MTETFEIIRIIFGSIYVLFLPGLVWSFFFPKENEIDWIERVALSFGLSIALVPLSVFWMNYLFKIKINLVNANHSPQKLQTHSFKCQVFKASNFKASKNNKIKEFF